MPYTIFTLLWYLVRYSWPLLLLLRLFCNKKPKNFYADSPQAWTETVAQMTKTNVSVKFRQLIVRSCHRIAERSWRVRFGMMIAAAEKSSSRELKELIVRVMIINYFIINMWACKLTKHNSGAPRHNGTRIKNNNKKKKTK